MEKQIRIKAAVLVIATGILGSAIAPALAADSAGADLYKTKCASCHGPDGRGDTPAGKALKVRDLHSAEVTAMSEKELTSVIAQGKNKMPPFGKSLKKEQIRQLVGYVRGLR